MLIDHREACNYTTPHHTTPHTHAHQSMIPSTAHTYTRTHIHTHTHTPSTDHIHTPISLRTIVRTTHTLLVRTTHTHAPAHYTASGRPLFIALVNMHTHTRARTWVASSAPVTGRVYIRQW